MTPEEIKSFLITACQPDDENAEAVDAATTVAAWHIHSVARIADALEALVRYK